jgi:hypothetical protein
MPTYQLLLHTSGINCLIDGSDSPAIGFYTTCRAVADTQDDAFRVIMDQFDSDPKIMDLIQSGYDAGLKPMTELQEVYKIPWYKSILPWTMPGLVFYDSDDEEE